MKAYTAVTLPGVQFKGDEKVRMLVEVLEHSIVYAFANLLGRRGRTDGRWERGCARCADRGVRSMGASGLVVEHE